MEDSKENSNGIRIFPKVFIIILNYNGKDVLRECLTSVFRVAYPNFEVVVVDNNSQDGSLEEAKTFFPRVHFIKNEENLGFSAGNNRGIRFALEKMADYVLLLNNDTLVDRAFLSELIEVAEKEEISGLICPLILESDKKRVWFSGGKIDWLRMKATNDKKVITESNYKSSFISGCAMMIKSSVFKRIGLLDEDYFLYWEDVDFSYRAKKAGFSTIVVPESKIVHLEKSEIRNSNKTYWLVLSGLIFFKKNSPWYIWPWISFYMRLRKLKNWLDQRKRKGAVPQMVHKAYLDFKNARF